MTPPRNTPIAGAPTRWVTRLRVCNNECASRTTTPATGAKVTRTHATLTVSMILTGVLGCTCTEVQQKSKRLNGTVLESATPPAGG